jgi:peptide chain release factor 2
MQQLAALKDTVDTWRGLEREAGSLRELIELSAEEEDESIHADLERDVAALAKQMDGLEFQLAFAGDYDDKSAFLSVYSGAGGTESQDWAEMLMRMFLRWGERRGFATELLDRTEGDEAGIKSATIEFRGPYAYGWLKSERGVHRLVRISPFDSSHSRHTSFALVEVMPEVDEAGVVEINPDDLRLDYFRASGHGGQNVQKNSTAVRITHIPTGTVVTCQNERSQGRNRESAMKVLEGKLIEIELEKQEEERARLKGQHLSAGWGNQIRSYVLHPYKMVKDHRTTEETSDTVAVLDGDLDAFMQAYLKASVGEDG